MTRTELIARLEAAEGPSRELDKLIGLECVGFNPNMLPTHIPQIGELPSPWPQYTSSFDVARGISNWLLLHASDIGADGLALVVLGDPTQTPTKEVSGIHSHLIIAACIAALKTQEAQK